MANRGMQSGGAIPFAVHGAADLPAVGIPWLGLDVVSKADAGALRGMHAWQDPAGDPFSKLAYRLPHHEIDGAVNLAGLRKALVDVVGAGEVEIPAGDRPGAFEHLEAHFKAAGEMIPAGIVAGLEKGFDRRGLLDARAWSLGGEVFSFVAKANVRKFDEEMGNVFGWASVSETAEGLLVFDGEGDAISPTELEKAAYDFNLDARQATDSHDRATIGAGDLIESMVFTKDKQDALGIDCAVGWWVGFHVRDEEMRKAIRDEGTRAMFSIGGAGIRTEVAA